MNSTLKTKSFLLLIQSFSVPNTFISIFPCLYTHEAGSYHIIVCPERSLNGSNIMSKPKFYYDSNGKLQLKINWQNAVDKTEDESLVESIDGLSVYDFFLKMATSQIPLPLHALGARMTYLLTFFLRITKPNFGGQWANVNEYWDSYAPYLFRSFAGSYGQTVRPSLYFPDNFTVVYQDGQSETYYSGVDIYLPSKVIDGVYQLNATEMQINLNQPGKGYEGYSDAMNIITDPKATRKLTQAQNGVQGKDSVQFEQHRKMVALEKRNLNQNDGYRFDYWTYLPPAFSGEDTAMGFKIDAEEGYAVLKIQGFNCFVSDALDMWKNMTLAAKEQGVKKLLIDISSNMGGNVVCGNAIAVAMFPSTNYELFQNVMDTPYNVPMQLYVKTIKPLIGTIENATEGTCEGADEGEISIKHSNASPFSYRRPAKISPPKRSPRESFLEHEVCTLIDWSSTFIFGSTNISKTVSAGSLDP